MSRLADIIGRVAEDVGAHADVLNELDGYAGDGDLGVTMRIGAQALAERLPEVRDAAPQAVLKACGVALARCAPSTAGTLVAGGLLGAGRAIADGGAAWSAVAQFSAALDAATADIAARGGAEPGSKTMLDALAPAAHAAKAESDAGETLGIVLVRAAAAAAAGAAATRDMAARHGRAGWLAERSAGHEDAGARLIAIALLAASRAYDELEGLTTTRPSGHPGGAETAGRD